MTLLLIMLFELTKKSESYIEKFTGKEKISKLRDSIKFENVEFSYSNSEVVLKNVNFRIKKFEKVLIMGESGSGKSTLIDLILQLQKIKKGKKFKIYIILIQTLKKWQVRTIH